MKPTQYVFSNKLNSYPAMNEYSPSYSDVKMGIITYVLIWIGVIAILIILLH